MACLGERYGDRVEQAQLARNDRGVAERAGRCAAQVVAPVIHEVRHDGGEGEYVAAGRYLGAQRRAVEADGAAEGVLHQHFHLCSSPTPATSELSAVPRQSREYFSAGPRQSREYLSAAAAERGTCRGRGTKLEVRQQKCPPTVTNAMGKWCNTSLKDQFTWFAYDNARTKNVHPLSQPPYAHS